MLLIIFSHKIAPFPHCQACPGILFGSLGRNPVQLLKIAACCATALPPPLLHSCATAQLRNLDYLGAGRPVIFLEHPATRRRVLWRQSMMVHQQLGPEVDHQPINCLDGRGKKAKYSKCTKYTKFTLVSKFLSKFYVDPKTPKSSWVIPK